MSIREQYIKDFRRKFTDKGQELYDIGKITKNDELYPSYDFAGMSEGNGQYQIGKGQTNNEGFLYKNFTDKDGNKVIYDAYEGKLLECRSVLQEIK